MPHLNSSSGDDHGSADEVKVYNDEGEEEEQRKSSENLIEDKVGLVNEGEQVSSLRSRIEYSNCTCTHFY